MARRTKQLLLLGTSLILLISFLLHIFAIRGNHFYFTVDEGRDAVYVREIINYHKIITRGPETSVRGIFTLPLWYYFIAIGFAIFNGNPFGAVFMMILLNLALTLVLILVLKSKVNAKAAILTGILLNMFWPFFSTSLYSFNPFPLVSLFILEIIFLIKLLEKKEKYFYLALIPVFLAFNTELAGAIVLSILYLLVSSYGAFKKIVPKLSFIVFCIGIPILGILKIINDFLDNPINNSSSGLGVLAGTNFRLITTEFIKSGALLFLVAFFVYLRKKNKNKFTKNFAILSLITLLISYFFFSLNHGWRDWQTVYLAPLLFISLLLIVFELPKKFAFLLLSIIAIAQLLSFTKNFKDYLNIKNDNGLMSTQISVLDWIYSHSEGNGFNSYTYTNTFYDYNYQYLFSLYGRNKYGFYPCEYSNFPLSHKELYIPGWMHYVEPKLGCDKWRFLIIESDTNGEANKDWINEFRITHHFVERTTIGKTVVEKYKTRDIY